MWRVTGAAIAIVVVAGCVAFAQSLRNETPAGVELTGDWVGGGFTEWNSNTRRQFDFLGIPLSEAAKAWTLSHSEEQLSEPERQCAFYTSPYFAYGFAPLPMWKETELRTGMTVAWVLP